MIEEPTCVGDPDETVVVVKCVDLRLQRELVVRVEAAYGEGGPWTLDRCRPPVSAKDLDVVKGRGAGTASTKLNTDDVKPRRVDDSHHRWVRFSVRTRKTFVT